MSTGAQIDADTLLEGYDETRKYLEVVEERDVPDGATVPRDELVETVTEWGYDRHTVRDTLDLLVERGDFERADDGVRPVRDEPVEDAEPDENPEKEPGSSESEASNPRVSATENDAHGDENVSSGACADVLPEWGEVDFTDPEPDVWAQEWLSRRFWMGRQGKMPYAPWASRDHPDADEDGNARYKWSITDNWTTKEKVDEWVEKDIRVDGYVVLLEKETDPYTDDPDPYAFVDGDDVRCPETGEVHPEFLNLLDRLGMTYADVSTSGSGVHALYEGALPEDVKQAVFEIDTEPWGENDEPPTVEIYDGKHVCVVTGDHVVGTPEHVHEWDEDALNEVLDEHLDEADRVTQTEGTDTDTENPLDGYEPEATDATETTDELDDVFYAVENLTPRDLPLRTKRVGEDATGWEKWNPSTYRQSSGEDSLHSPPGESVFYDQKTGRSFGLLSLYAVEQGILTKPWETFDGSDWWDAVEAARDDGAPIPEYEPSDGYDDRDAERHHVLDTDAVEKTRIFEDLTDKKRHLRKRDELPTTREVRDGIDETVKENMKRGKKTVVEAPTSAGKSYTVATTPWTGFKDVTDDQPVVHLHKTKDARREAYADSKDANVKARELVGRTDERRGCPIARGDFDEEVEMDGVAPSVWIDAACEGKKLPFSMVHAEAVRRIDENAPGLLDEHGVACPDCAPVTQHEGVPRNDDGDPSLDVIHATHQFGHVPSYLVNCNVVVDEQPDYRVELSRDRIRRAVTAFLQEVDAPLDTFERLLVGRGNEHLEVGEEKVVEALEREPSKSWYFENDAAHALAPALARAVWYARDGGNRRKKARVYHEPPRLDDDRGDGGLGCYVTLILDEVPRQDGEEDAVVYSVPNFGAARSVIGLDARPCMDVWGLNTVPEVGREAVLDPEERRNWRFFERGLRVVQVGDATRPVGGNGEYFDDDGERAVLENLVKEYGDEFRTVGTAKAVEDDAVEMLKEVLEKHGYDPELVESLHYGEEKSRNVPAFMDALVGYVTHCIDPGDDYVLDVIAARGLDARPERSSEECHECDGDGCHKCDGTGYERAHGRGFVGEDADKAKEILESVRGNHVAQMIGRYARDASSEDVSVVFARTDACTDDLVDAKVKDVAWTYGEKQKAVVEYIRETDERQTAREIRDGVADRFDDGITKQHVAETLRRVEAYGDARREREAGDNGADVWTWTGDAGALTDTGVLDLSTEDANVERIVNSDVWSNYTFDFTVCTPKPVGGGAKASVDASRPDSGGVDPGLNRTLDAYDAD